MRALGTTKPGFADLLTLSNALCGAGTLLVATTLSLRPVHGAVSNGLTLVAVLLLVGTILDVLDGAAARRWGSTPLGRPLDNLADGVTFGVAPALAVAAVELVGNAGWSAGVVVAGALVYVAAALLRLADFWAVHSGDAYFTGLPSPLGAVGALAICLLAPGPVVAGLGLVVLGLLMVGPLLYPAQRGAGLALALAGWGFGFLGIFGVIDVRIPSVATLVVITLLAPAWSTLRSRATVRVVEPA